MVDFSPLQKPGDLQQKAIEEEAGIFVKFPSIFKLFLTEKTAKIEENTIKRPIRLKKASFFLKKNHVKKAAVQMHLKKMK